MTPQQKRAIALMREHGGYACLCCRRWYVAQWVERSGWFVRLPIPLNTRVMRSLYGARVLHPLEGCGYGSNSFWHLEVEVTV